MITEYVNLAVDLDQEELDDIGVSVYEDYISDKESRSEWEEKHKEWLELYFQKDAPQHGAWEGSSDESLPLLTEACNQFQSRSYKSFFPTRNFVSAIPVGQNVSKDFMERKARAKLIGEHMSFQLGVMNKGYKREKNQMFLAVALHGSDFTKTYYDPMRRKAVVRRVPVTHFFVPYGVGPRSLEDIPRKTELMYVPVNDTKILAARDDKWFIEPAKPMGMTNNIPLEDTENEIQGIESPDIEEDIYFAELIEQHCLLDLDDDGIAEPYIVTVDCTTQKVLRIAINYEVDESGNPTDNKNPIEYFTHYQALPNPDGFYGLGFGHLIGDINKSANRMLREIVDAGELANVGNMSGFISEGLAVDGEDQELVLGEFRKVSRTFEDIRKGVITMNFPGPNPSLYSALEYVVGFAQRVSSASEALSGATDKVYQPTTILTMVEQGMQLISSVQEFLALSLEEELEKIYTINRKYLDQMNNGFFANENGVFDVTQQDYMNDYKVVPIFDPNSATKQQRLAKAEAEYQFAIQNPLIANNPESLRVASARYLAALEVDNIEELLPQQPEVQRIDDQYAENAQFMLPREQRMLFDVFEDQDHAEHIAKIDEFIIQLQESQQQSENEGLADEIADKMYEMTITDLMMHRKKHEHYLYMQGVMNAQKGMAGITSDEEAALALMQQAGGVV